MLRFSSSLFAALILTCTTSVAQTNDPNLKSRTAALKVLDRNLKHPSPLSQFWHVNPAPQYPAIYLWDSAFIAEIWRRLDVEKSQDIVRSVLEGQDDVGRVPHQRSYLGRSKWIQPPLLSWVTLRIFRSSGDLQFLKDTYPKLLRFHQWMDQHRRHSDGLYFWDHPYESGIDNSPRFSDRSEKNFSDTRSLAAIDLSSYMVMDGESLFAIAEALGDQATAARLKLKTSALKSLIQAKLYDQVSGLYFDWDYKQKKHIKIDTIAGLVPLTAGIPSTTEALRLRQHILRSDTYNTLIPFPSVAVNDATFEKDMWRGPVWVNMAYLAILGLDRYGFKADATEMSKRLVTGVYSVHRRHGSFYEFYDPFRFDLNEVTRKKGNTWKQISLGSKPVKNFVGWTGLVLNLEKGLD